MKRCLFCLVITSVFFAYAKAQTKSDEMMVRGVPQAFIAAWAKHDGHELAKIMSPNVDFVNVGGDWLHGLSDVKLSFRSTTT
jgi:uncharacterized protein (TIGR02246 family)